MRVLPFEIIQDRQRGSEMARFTCRRCGGHDLLPLVRQAKAFNPQATVKRALAAGWDSSGLVATCPACMAARAAQRKGESPGPKAPAAEVIRMSDAKPAPREATPQERVKIRAILDKHFDDGAGCWLDGYSDQKAGEEIGVPWALITRIREAAYGPIRVDPEVAALRAELVHIQREVQAISERWETERKALAGKLESAAKRLDALHAKRCAA